MRALIKTVTIPTLAIATVAVVVTPIAWFAAVLLLPMVGAALLQRRFHRFALMDGSLQVMRGVVAQRDWIVPTDNVQVVTLRQGLLQRALSVASVLVDTAGAKGMGGPDVVDVNLPDARELAVGLMARLG